MKQKFWEKNAGKLIDRKCLKDQLWEKGSGKRGGEGELIWNIIEKISITTSRSRPPSLSSIDVRT